MDLKKMKIIMKYYLRRPCKHLFSVTAKPEGGAVVARKPAAGVFRLMLVPCQCSCSPSGHTGQWEYIRHEKLLPGSTYFGISLMSSHMSHVKHVPPLGLKGSIFF